MFSWNPQTPEDSKPFLSNIQPTEVLYEVDDEPLLFTARSDLFPVLCYKTDAEGTASQYLVVPTTNSVIAHLRQGMTALRSALSQAWGWIVEADGTFAVKRTWTTPVDAVPDAVLPQPGYGMHPGQGFIHERMAQVADAFLSIRFRGAVAKGHRLPFGVLKGLLDDVSTTLWMIFSGAIQEAAPNVTEKTVRRALQIPTYEPAFSSLLIAFERPQLDLSGFRNKPDIDLRRADKNIARAYNSFFHSAGTVARAVARGQITRALVSTNLDLVEAVVPLIPTKYSFFDSVEIRRQDTKKRPPLVIDVKAGDQIREAYALSLAGDRTVEGRVVEINSRSSTFLVMNQNFRLTTCVANTDPLRGAITSLTNGMAVNVTGSFQKRKVRDKLYIDRMTVAGFTTRANPDV